MITALKKAFKWCFIIAISACILIFAANNYSPVDISLFPFPYTGEIRTFLLVLICFALGVITGGMLSSMQNIKWRLKSRNQQQRVVALENELLTLKSTLPVHQTLNSLVKP